MREDIDPDKIEDPHAKQCVLTLLNLAESHLEQIQLLKEQVQLLRDEIARLKGQQGKPDIKPNKPAVDHSSKAQRRLPTVWQKRPKRDFLEVTHTCDLAIDLTTLPLDAEFKGYEEFPIQDLQLVWENSCFRREKYYSPSTNQTYLAPLPEGYDTHFGPGIKSLFSVAGISGQHEPGRLHQLRLLAKRSGLDQSQLDELTPFGNLPSQSVSKMRSDVTKQREKSLCFPSQSVQAPKSAPSLPGQLIIGWWISARLMLSLRPAWVALIEVGFCMVIALLHPSPKYRWIVRQKGEVLPAAFRYVRVDELSISREAQSAR